MNNESCGKVGNYEYNKRKRKGVTCKNNCIRYMNKDLPCSRYPDKEGITYYKLELSHTCIHFKQK